MQNISGSQKFSHVVIAKKINSEMEIEERNKKSTRICNTYNNERERTVMRRGSEEDRMEGGPYSDAYAHPPP